MQSIFPQTPGISQAIEMSIYISDYQASLNKKFSVAIFPQTPGISQARELTIQISNYQTSQNGKFIFKEKSIKNNTYKTSIRKKRRRFHLIQSKPHKESSHIISALLVKTLRGEVF